MTTPGSTATPKADTKNLGVTVKGFVAAVIPFKSKKGSQFYRIRVFDGSGMMDVISKQNGLGEGEFYHGKGRLSGRHYQGQVTISFFEDERIAG